MTDPVPAKADPGKTAASLLQSKIDAGAFDVFLCHNHQDKPKVKELGKALKDQGVLPWLDEWELRPGLRWQSALEDQIENVKSAAVFVGAEGIGPWQNEEIDAFLRTFVEKKRPVIPVLLETAPKEPGLPVFLTGRTWVDFRSQDPDPMAQLLWGITGQRSQPGSLAPHPPPLKDEPGRPPTLSSFPSQPPKKAFPEILVGSWQVRINSPNGLMVNALLQIFPNGGFQGQLPTPLGITNMEGVWQADANGNLYMQGRQFIGFQVMPYMAALSLVQTAPLQLTGMTVAGEHTIWQKIS